MRTLAIAFLAAALLQAQPGKQAEVDKIFSAFNTHTPGCSVGVSVKGQTVLKSGYGMADLERNVPITADTIFESGSVAKQFTAAALILLAQQGKISLDDPMRKYLPELPEYGTPLTIRHVLSHISGLREWRAVGAFSAFPEGKLVYTNQDLLDLASRQTALNFEPGTNYSYTNTGFNISTILIERALSNGKTFQDFTREMIFSPLGMTHSRWRDNFRTVIPNRALAYAKEGNGWIGDTPVENIIGAGGLLTNVSDLLLWNENFNHHKAGGPEMTKLQENTATLKNGRKIIYAAGLQVSTFDGFREVSHSGATGGYRTWLARYPEQGVSVAVLCNAANANPTALGRETARLWTGGKPNPANISAALNPAVTGMYRLVRDNTDTQLQIRNGKMFLGTSELSPADKFEGTTLTVSTPTGDLVYQKVEPVAPSSAELAEFTGAYSSSETLTTIRVTFDGTALRYGIGNNLPVPLRPTFRDTFATPANASIHFLRDASGKISGLSAGESRVWDLRFTRIAK